MLLFRKYIQMVQAAAVLHHCSWSPAYQHSIIWTVQLIQHFQQAMQTVVWLHTVRMCHHLHHHSVKQQLNVMFKQTECWFKWFRTVTWHSRRKTRRQDPENRQKEQSHNTQQTQSMQTRRDLQTAGISLTSRTWSQYYCTAGFLLSSVNFIRSSLYMYSMWPVVLQTQCQKGKQYQIISIACTWYSAAR